MKTQKKLFQSLLFVQTIEPSINMIIDELKGQGVDIKINSADLAVISPIKDSISINEIRNLKKQIWEHPLSGKNKVAIIKKADKLTLEAQNSLLKLLEEPPTHAIIAMVSQSDKNFLPTIISRVKKVHLKNPNLIELKNHPKTLESVSQIEDPKSFLDQEIMNYYVEFTNAIEDSTKRKRIARILELGVLSKKMIKANVNAKFALINYFLASEQAK